MSDERKKTLYYLSQLNTREIFPKLYDGFKEIDELAKGEEELISVARDCVKLVASDKYITEANATKVAEYESELGLSPTGLSIEERREQLVNFLGRNRVINDAAVHEKAKRESGIDDIDVTTDCTALTMVISAPENSEDEDEGQKVIDAARAMLPYAPQNLSIGAAVKSTNDVNINAFNTQFSTLRSDAGDATCDVYLKMTNTPIPSNMDDIAWAATAAVFEVDISEATEMVNAYKENYNVGLGDVLSWGEALKRLSRWNDASINLYKQYLGDAYIEHVNSAPPVPETQYQYGTMSNEGDADGKHVEFGEMLSIALMSEEE